MKKIKAFVNKNYKVVIGIIIGITISIVIGVSAVATKDVVYDNSKSGLTSTNLQGAIDELNTKATTKIKEAEAKCPDGYKCTKQATNIVDAYTYNQTSGASNYCVTGEESTCVKTSCYENKTSGSCSSGTIIKYKVNATEEKYFYVLHDDGGTMTMQQREDELNSKWYSADYDESKGPTTLLPALESATSDWTNVNDQTYTMGTTNFNNTNAYTGCSSYNSCTTNTYTLGQRTAKARAIIIQEATALGCTESSKQCPIWMYNYMCDSLNYGGTVNGGNSTNNFLYWTMTAYYSGSGTAWGVCTTGNINRTYPVTANVGVRAVVVVNK